MESPSRYSPSKSAVSLRALSKSKARHDSIAYELHRAHLLYTAGNYSGAIEICEGVYEQQAYRVDNLILLGVNHFQLKHFSESMFYLQQAIRVDANCAEAYSNMGNAFKELGDYSSAIQFYLQAIKLKPRYSHAYNNLAICYLQQGLIEDAIDTFQMALLLKPDLVDAHSNLGIVFKSQGNLEAAKKCFLEAIRLKQDFPIAWNNLAGVFKDDGLLDTAETYYLEAIRLSPQFADAHSNLGTVYREMKRFEEAIDCYKEAIRIRPEFATAHGNLGASYMDIGDFRESIRSLRYAIQLDPRCADFFNNLGIALKASSQSQQAIEEAVQCFRSALRIQPNFPHAYNNLGCALLELCMVQEALHCFVTSARLSPTSSSAHCNIGSIMAEHGLFSQAMGHFEEALKNSPESAEVQLGLGNTLKEMGKFDEASSCYRRAIELDDTLVEAHENFAVLLGDSGKYSEALEKLQKAHLLRKDNLSVIALLINMKGTLCMWENWDDDVKSLMTACRSQLAEDRPGSRTSFVPGGGLKQISHFAQRFALPVLQPQHALRYPFTGSELLQITRRYGTKAKFFSSLFTTDFKYKNKLKQGRLRVGYVSVSFNDTPLMHLLRSLFDYHDSTKFDVFCYSLTPSDGSIVRQFLESEIHHFRDVSNMHFSEVASIINEDDIHVLINLDGYAQGCKNEIFALRPAPLQIAMLGYCGSLGTDFIDYIIVDKTITSADHREYFSESLIILPHSFVMTSHQKYHGYILNQDKSTFPSRAQYGISEDKFVFCNFGPSHKIEPEIFSTWMNVLKRVPNSVLWLIQASEEIVLNLKKEALQRDVLEDRLVFSVVASYDEQIKRGILADLFLDTAGFNAITPACDVLWAGTPLLTVEGSRMVSRVGASVLNAVGLSQLVCTDILQYEDEAVSLALDPDRLFGMRRHLEACRGTSALFDTARWVRNLENGLINAWRNYEQKQGLRDVVVEDAGPLYILNSTDTIAY